MTDAPPESVVWEALEDRIDLDTASIIDYEAILVEEKPYRVYDLRVEVDSPDWHGEFFFPKGATRSPPVERLVQSDEEEDETDGLERWADYFDQE